MSRRVLFNGVVLVRPGAATKIDASQFENVALGGLGIVGLVGDADGGQPRVVKVFTTALGVKEHYLSGDLVEAANIAADPSNDPRITTGAQVIICYKTNNSVQASLAHDGKFTFNDRNYGLKGNSITVAIADGGSSTRIITIATLDDQGLLQSVSSPALGGTGKFSVQYVGAGSACTATISVAGGVLTFATTVTAGPGGENLSLTSDNYPTLNALIRAIDAMPGYTATSLITNDLAFDTRDLDAIVGVDIRTSLTTIYARNFDLSDWVNTNSPVISATLTRGQTAPCVVLTQTSLAGGTRGTSDNTAWSTAFTAMGGLRINQLVPLASADATTTQGTYTVDSITAALTAHCKLLSGTSGRNERQGWIGLSKTKTALITALTTQNSEHLCVVGQKIKRLKVQTGLIEFLPEWGMAVCLAGLRAGAPLGEPLTYKYINASGISSDASWSEATSSDVVDLVLNGLIVINEVRGKGFRVDKCVTTYTKSDNDAFTEETIVQIWKSVGYELRTVLEDRFTGRPGNIQTVQAVKPTVVALMEKFRDAGSITDSSENGAVTKAYRNIQVALNGDQMTVSLTFSPTPGINFILNTLALVPARISF